MSKEQIEEMGFIIQENSPLSKISSEDVAEILYNAGYHKHREGEWKKMYDKAPRYVCTSCSHLYNNKEYKYCPNCGARMKGGE